jgi:hypothetical protein
VVAEPYADGFTNGEAINLPESWPEKLVLPFEDCRSLLRSRQAPDDCLLNQATPEPTNGKECGMTHAKTIDNGAYSKWLSEVQRHQFLVSVRLTLWWTSLS